MTSEQSKTAPGAPEQPFTTTAAASTSAPQFPQFPAGYAPALPPGYPPFFAFPPPTDGQQGEGTPPALPYPLLYTPPGMVYAFSPPVPAATQATSAEASRPKRRQVKMACTNCAAACKRCDEARPCERCKKYGIADSCVDGQRKERKKGVKRGPYKRKNKSPSDNPESTPQSSEGGEWSQGTSPPSNATAAPAALPAVAQLPPEGFYPVYLPPGYGLPEPQPNADGSAPTGPPTLVPVYISGFAPYGYPPGAIFQLTSPGTHPPHPPVTQPPTAEAGTVPVADKSSSEVASPRTGSSIATAAQDTVNEDTRGVKPGEDAKALSEAGAISTYDGSTSDV